MTMSRRDIHHVIRFARRTALSVFCCGVAAAGGFAVLGQPGAAILLGCLSLLGLSRVLKPGRRPGASPLRYFGLELIVWGVVGLVVTAAGAAVLLGALRGGTVLGGLVVLSGLSWTGMTIKVTMGFAAMSRPPSK